MIKPFTNRTDRNPPPAAIDPGWRIQLIVLALLTLVTTVLFWSTEFDLIVAAGFYQPSASGTPWPDEFLPLWRFLYHGVPVLTTVLALGGLAALFLGWIKKKRFLAWRRPALLLLLTLAIGPGLLVNALFKDQWGRPRPRDLVQFQGTMQYLPPLKMGSDRKGRSFTAGHASVGFCLVVWWFVWRRRRPSLAWAALLASILLGTLLGIGRMAAGAHFLSDVLMAGYVTYCTALVLHYFVLPEWDNG